MRYILFYTILIVQVGCSYETESCSSYGGKPISSDAVLETMLKNEKISVGKDAAVIAASDPESRGNARLWIIRATKNEVKIPHDGTTAASMERKITDDIELVQVVVPHCKIPKITKSSYYWWDTQSYEYTLVTLLAEDEMYIYLQQSSSVP